MKPDRIIEMSEALATVDLQFADKLKKTLDGLEKSLVKGLSSLDLQSIKKLPLSTRNKFIESQPDPSVRKLVKKYDPHSVGLDKKPNSEIRNHIVSLLNGSVEPAIQPNQTEKKPAKAKSSKPKSIVAQRGVLVGKS